tara:strand:- start:5039 stop:5383 length:345 start_codon:yes stop_codon:yes gene_type:complete
VFGIILRSDPYNIGGQLLFRFCLATYDSDGAQKDCTSVENYAMINFKHWAKRFEFMAGYFWYLIVVKVPNIANLLYPCCFFLAVLRSMNEVFLSLEIISNILFKTLIFIETDVK